MNINVYTGFSKKKNSTKVPTGTGTAVMASLKRQTSYHNPVFVLSPITGVSMEDISYVKYGSHYYFVTDITVVPNNVYEISCVEDPMATHRSEILGSTQLVVRSASSNNPMIPDTLLPVETSDTSTGIQASVAMLDGTGFYIVTCINSVSENSGITCTYLMNEANIRLLGNYLNVDLVNMDTSATTLIEKLRSLLSGPMDAIVSVKWLPFDLNTIVLELSLSSYNVYLGPSQVSAGGTPVTGYKLSSDCVYQFTDSIPVPSSYSDDFRINSQYTTMRLYIPGYGHTEVDPVLCAKGVSIRYALDVLTGDIMGIIYGYPTTYLSDEVEIATINYNIAVPLPIAQMSSDVVGGVVSAVGAMAGAAAAASVGAGAAVASSVVGANDIANKIIPTASVKGSIAGKSYVKETNLTLYITRKTTAGLNDLNANQGRPLFASVTLSTLSGYCKCENASVSIAGYDDDRNYINNILNTGFFIE